VLEQLAGEWGDSVKVVKLDVDQAPQITIDYQVLSVPTMMLFKHGKMVERLVGYQPKEKINTRVQPHLQPA
jgi:thioredoxin 1